MIHRLLLIFGVALWLNGANINAQTKMVLTGQTTDVQIREETASVLVTVALDLTLKNESQTNVILYWHEFYIVEDSLHRFTENDKREVLYRSSTLPSINRSREWSVLQNRLNVPRPPNGLTRILKSGESITLKRITGMRFYRKGQYNAPWKEIPAASPLWLTVTLDMFPSNLDKSPSSQQSFGERLQRKWSPIGTLQLGVLKSQPIRLDLSNR